MSDSCTFISVLITNAHCEGDRSCEVQSEVDINEHAQDYKTTLHDPTVSDEQFTTIFKRVFTFSPLSHVFLTLSPLSHVFSKFSRYSNVFQSFRPIQTFFKFSRHFHDFSCFRPSHVFLTNSPLSHVFKDFTFLHVF